MCWNLLVWVKKRLFPLGLVDIGMHGGRAIRFNESEVRPMGRGAAGVRAASLREGDHVVEMDVLPAGAPPSDEVVEEVEVPELEAEPETDETLEVTAADNRGYIFTVTEKGFGKRTPVSAYPVKHRGGYGVIDIKVNDRNGNVAGIAHVFDGDQVLLITEMGMIIRVPVDSIRSINRNTQGVRVINLEEGDTVVAAVKVVDREDDKEQPDDAGDETSVEEGSDEEPVH